MLNSYVDPLLRRTGPLQGVLIAVAFWALAALALLNLRNLHLWGLPGVQFTGAWATILCCLIVVSLVGIRYSGSRREPVWSVSLWRRSIGTPGLLLFAAVASYLAIGATVLVVEGNWQPDTAGDLKYRVLQFGVLVAAALGGRAVLERTGADRLLGGVLVILIASCAVILASPVLRELGILPPYRISFRLTGAFTDPNDAGLVACMTVALALAFLTNGGPRMLGYAGLAMGTAATLATAARTGFLVLVAILVLFALLNLRDKRSTIFLLSWIGGLIGLAVVAIQLTPWAWLRDVADEDRADRLFCESPSDGRPGEYADCAVLLAVKDVLAGDVALNWSPLLPVRRWEGVRVDAEGRVTRLDVEARALNGRIPPELGRLHRLVVLRLPNNRLTGPIPPELGNLINLEYLSLNFNLLTGPIPPELAKLSNLEKLWLRGNRLTGPVPPQLGEIDSLSLVRLAGNDLARPVPPALYALEDHDLDAALSCRPGRSAPGLLADCALLLAVKDGLAGDAPLNWSPGVPLEEWQGVTVDRLRGRVTALDLAQTGLNGRIPPELGRLDGLVSLRLSRNRLAGPIPPELGGLSRLRTLWLDDNRLGGPVPPELGKLSRLADLRLKANPRLGPLPPSVAALPGPAAVRFAGDEASTGGRGGVADESPRCRAAATRLYSDCSTLLEVRDKLAGDVVLNWSATLPVDHWRGVTLGFPPAVVGAAVQVPRIVALDLSHMGLNGHIPAELSALDELAVLHLGDNRLGGPIPPGLGALAGLRTLTLENNALTGTIPEEFGALRQLVWLHLGGNELTGSLPRWLGEQEHLEALRLENNRLHGDIPPKLFRLPRLADLRLGGNALSGCIPLTWGAAHVRDDNVEPDLLCRPPFWRKPGLFEDAARLMLARDVLAGDAPLNWSYANPVESWQGVSLDRSGHIAGLDLRDMNLGGRIPLELGELSRLVWLRLDGNRLAGPIPPELGKLTHLKVLSLSDNNLTGLIPPELGDLSNLRVLWLDDNRLGGPVPPELGAVDIRSLRVAGNDIAGAGTSEMDKPDRGTFLENLGAALRNQRLLLWTLGFEKATEAPLFGHGLGALKSLDSAPISVRGTPLGVHNMYLILLGEAGIVPALLFVLSITLLLRSQWTAPKSPARDAAAGWVITIALHGMTSQHVLLVGAAMFLAGLSVAMSAVRDEGDLCPAKS